MSQDAKRIDEYTKTEIHIKNQGRYTLILEPALVMRKDAERIDEYTKTGMHIKNQYR